MIVEIEGKEYHRVPNPNDSCLLPGARCAFFEGSCAERKHTCSITFGAKENVAFLTRESYLHYIAAKLRK